jgi:hypothetical protein
VRGHAARAPGDPRRRAHGRCVPPTLANMVDVLEAHGVFAAPVSPNAARPSPAAAAAAPRAEGAAAAHGGALWGETWAVMDRVNPALRKQRFG